MDIKETSNDYLSARRTSTAWIGEGREDISLQTIAATSYPKVQEMETVLVSSHSSEKNSPLSVKQARQSHSHRKKLRDVESRPRNIQSQESSSMEDPVSPMRNEMIPPKPAPRRKKQLVDDNTIQFFPELEVDKKTEVDSSLQDDASSKDGASVGSHRLSLGDSSLDGRSLTSQSDNRSFRDKLHDRFQAVKERAGTSLVDTHSRSRLRQQRINHPIVSRFDEGLQKEESAMGTALKKHAQARVRWKDTVQQSTEGASIEAAYDFFTQVWEDGTHQSEHEEPIQAGPDMSTDRDEEIEESEDQKIKLVAADYLGLKDDWDPLEIVAPVYHSEKERIQQEDALLYFPNRSPVPLQDKLEPNCEPRFLEEEGLYVGRRPPMHRKNKISLENRLLASGSRKWFGEDGEILTIPDSTNENPLRPPKSRSYFADVIFKPVNANVFIIN